MSQRRERQSRKQFNPGGIILEAAALPAGSKYATAVECLEALRDKTAAEDWAKKDAQHSVLYGIKLAIAALRQESKNEAAQ